MFRLRDLPFLCDKPGNSSMNTISHRSRKVSTKSPYITEFEKKNVPVIHSVQAHTVIIEIENLIFKEQISLRFHCFNSFK